MATISYYDIWRTSENIGMTDEDLLLFAKGLFQDGFIKVSTIYDDELNKNVTRYDITAAKLVENKKEEKKKEEPTKEEKSFEAADPMDEKPFFRRIFSK